MGRKIKRSKCKEMVDYYKNSDFSYTVKLRIFTKRKPFEFRFVDVLTRIFQKMKNVLYRITRSAITSFFWIDFVIRGTL